MRLYIDLTELVREPLQTGIQRAERALIRHWPGPAPLMPCAYDPATHSMRTLPAELLAALTEETKNGGVAAEARRLNKFRRLGPAIKPNDARLLCAELFDDPGRAAFYAALGAGRGPGPIVPYWLVYDFLPWLRPEWFGAGAARQLMPYVDALHTVRHVAFISRQTRDDYVHRVIRGAHAGPVIPMGADGLRLETQHWSPARRDIVMLGTIEARKNVVPALQAMRRLWAEGSTAGLTLIGKVSGHAVAERALIQELAAEKRFRHRVDLPDGEVRDALREARAVLFPSEGEGYGIPPMEGFHAGIPAVVAASLPALDGLPTLGHIRLSPVTADSIADALRIVLDDTQAARLWQEAAGLRVPGWADFAQKLAGWVQA